MVKINDINYEIIEDNKNAFDIGVVEEKLTDYFYDYDYVLGDWAYGKLRLKGFNDKKNKNYNKINAYENIKGYIEENCAYGCKYFIIKRISVDKETKMW